MHQGQEDGTRLGGMLGPSRYKGTSIKPLPGFPFFAGIFQLDEESLIQGKHPCLLELIFISNVPGPSRPVEILKCIGTD